MSGRSVSDVTARSTAERGLISDYETISHPPPSALKRVTNETSLSAIYASYNSAMVVYLTEIVPPEVRASGFSLAYGLATAVGGFTPFIVTWAIGKTHSQAVAGIWLTLVAAISLAAVLISTPFVREEPT